MITLTYTTLSEICKGEIIRRGKKDSFQGISIDTRTAEKDMLFLPLKGQRFDGHHFIREAYEKGISGVLIDKDQKLNTDGLDGIYIIEVEDTLKALMDISSYYRRLFDLPCIGVTGSTGKTTTKDMISAVLGNRFKILKNIGNYNNQIGLPLTIFNLEPQHQMAVLEMGMSSLGEIDSLANIANPNIGVITNIGMSHIEHLGSRENIMRAKMEITNYMNSQDYLLLNGDDQFLSQMRNVPTKFIKIFFGLSKDNDIFPEEIQANKNGGYSIVIHWKGKAISFNILQPGIHNVYNALASIWIAFHYNISPEEIQTSLDEFKPSSMRLEIHQFNNIKVINDAYNASPDSMRAALAVLNLQKGNKLAILGNILEMGTFSEEGHRMVGADLALTDINNLVTVGEMAKWIGEEATKHKVDLDWHSFNNNEELIKDLPKILQNIDAILVKGSRGMRMEEIVYYLQERS
ncbi:UDP-N-acetylmuramoyl-tripeptide--D-alanyl-D-alanine ligase [Alkaliphilus serpentinus]|uniref:UDP-N-acetylmuramoyl-tripeptide--D-alanyl-D-alanine ligase n=1 Tax=Alkaliphilus serpentinus TaxID=1482731 RepID=A0A833HRF3_9FIRM|nr:UDP-N-acetylmuramoyl-tripeptide--D-alanyl-D-alanine ligase [Alkaliphilus serpentinus]KAB3533197.1 UDP-N-acetylmuramoyl-tripeptide--D-alanyl-D-alanine ligase [Alkaliphilus serpentinus]